MMLLLLLLLQAPESTFLHLTWVLASAKCLGLQIRSQKHLVAIYNIVHGNVPFHIHIFLVFVQSTIYYPKNENPLNLRCIYVTVI